MLSISCDVGAGVANNHWKDVLLTDCWIDSSFLFQGPGAAYCPESTLPPLSLLEPLLEAQENKSRSSSILDSSCKLVIIELLEEAKLDKEIV